MRKSGKMPNKKQALNKNKKDIQKGFYKEVNKKRDELAREISKLASKANKRLKRLRVNKLRSSPAYKKVRRERKVMKFSVKNKNYNQLQKEKAQLTNFLNSTTSSVRGMNRVLKKIAKDTKYKYKSVKELPKALSQFFELSVKVQEIKRHDDMTINTFGSNQLHESINEMIKEDQITLGEIGNDLDKIAYKVAQSQSLKPAVDKWNFESFGVEDNSFKK
jgi:K+/H+ antiporter YhaU regulatory subunit KhtT